MSRSGVLCIFKTSACRSACEYFFIFYFFARVRALRAGLEPINSFLLKYDSINHISTSIMLIMIYDVYDVLRVVIEYRIVKLLSDYYSIISIDIVFI